MNVLCPPNPYVEILTPNIIVLEGVWGRGLGHEGGTLMNKISALVKQILESSPTSSHVSYGEKKRAIYEPGNGPPPDTESALATSRTVRNKFLLFPIEYPIYSIFLEQSKWTKLRSEPCRYL